MYLRLITILFVTFICINCGFTQSYVNNYVNPIYTSLPFLRAIPDAKISGMGDAGIAQLNANAIFLNGSAINFMDDSTGVALNYKSSGSRLLSLSAYTLFSEKDAMSAGLRYNDLGNSTYATNNGLQTVGSYEYSLDVHYSRKLSENFAGGATLKYIYSKILEGMIVNGLEMSPASVFAGDLSLFYKNDITFNQKPAVFTFGLNLSNLGNKITYTSSVYEQYIPSNFGMGIALTTQINDLNVFTVTMDLNKLLVPTIYQSEQSLIKGMVSSFNDAPGGINEELKEITFSPGMEYIYNDLVFVRAGYFFENPLKGPRKYFTAGTGIRYRDIQLDVAYRFFNNTQQLVAEKVLSMTLSVAL
jgi:hypothetical protein